MSQRLELGFDDAAIGMVLLTPDLRVIRVNDALCALLGRDAEQLLGRSILEFTHPEDVKRSLRWSRSRYKGNEGRRWTSATSVRTDRSSTQP